MTPEIEAELAEIRAVLAHFAKPEVRADADLQGSARCVSIVTLEHIMGFVPLPVDSALTVENLRT